MSTDGNGQVRLYAGMHDGVCAITNAGNGGRWSQSNVTSLEHAAARFATSPGGPGRAYLAAYESGLLRTDDGGASWQKLASYPSEYAHSVQAHPDDPDVVYVGGEPSAIFLSQDGGQTWKECATFRAVPESERWFFHSPTRKSHVRDLRMAPDDPGTLYAGIEVGGIVRSVDGGESWEQMEGTDDDIHLLNISPARPRSVYAATAAGPYRSDDGGKTWTPLNSGLERTYTVYITAAPNDADRVLVSVSKGPSRQGPQLHRSSDGGHQWTMVKQVGSDGDMAVALDWDVARPGHVYAGTDGGAVYHSTDYGDSWENLPVKLSSMAIGGLVVAPA